MSNTSSSVPTILLVNDIPTHHQMPLAESLHSLLGSNFKFAIKGPMTEDRSSIGWQDESCDKPWVLRTWESAENWAEYTRWVRDADAVVGWYIERDMLMARAKTERLCLLTAERILKLSNLFSRTRPADKGFQGMTGWLRYQKNKRAFFGSFRELDRPSCHYLAIGAYAAHDMARITKFENRMWTYGYFVAVPSEAPAKRANEKKKILWLGRMLDLKRVDDLIRAAGILCSKNIVFELVIRGEGPEKEKLSALAHRVGAMDAVKFEFPCFAAQAVIEMEKADIYVLPSSGEEGWGAVIGEAMGRGCAVVASQSAGAAPVLIKHGDTGFLYPCGDINAFAGILEVLLLDPGLAEKVGNNAWQNIGNNWSPSAAADRMLRFVEGQLGKGPKTGFTSGPFSPAPMIAPPQEPV